jgi:hypothetical protein
MRRAEREALRARYQFRCGYCGTDEVDAGGELTVDHFQPRSRDGPDTPENWVYACIVCNDFKGDFWHPDSDQRVLHPLRDDLAEHFHEAEHGRLVPLTETGRFHIERLQLNRTQLVLRRQRRQQIQLLHQQLAHLEEENALLLRLLHGVEEQVRLLIEQAEREIE